MVNEPHTHILGSERELYESIGSMAANAGLSPPLVLKHLKKDVRATPQPKRALTNLHRFLSAGFASSWLRDVQEHRLLQQIALELFSQSQFLADILVRHPELFHWLTSSSALKVTKQAKEYSSEAIDAMKLFQRVEKRLDSLKRFQRRELLRIGARQILGEAPMRVTSAELSALADALIGSTLELGRQYLADQTGVQLENTLCVISLGKLGGEELNFSSDIDLLFVYDEDGPLSSPSGRMSTLHEYYARLAEFEVRRLSEHTAEGHLYRVDMRLRPEGHSGPLAMSRSAYMTYYETRGELWERQMLIKARVIAGNRIVGERWLNDLQPFVFPRTHLGSPLEEIARIKAKIESKIKGESNIKLGSGGIRDIEFIVQALQLLNGGQNPSLRERNTLRAMTQLSDASLLEKREAEKLSDAYQFLRVIEDRLQLLHGLQRHALPSSHDEKHVLARQLGFRSIAVFDAALRRHRQIVQRVFRSVFAVAKPIGRRAGSGDRAWLRVSSSGLKRIGFIDTTAAERHLGSIMKDLAELEADEGRRTLLSSVRKHGAPDWCLGNFLLLASAKPIKRTLQQAMQNRELADLLLLVCSRSSRLARLISQEPLLFETLVGRPEEMLAPARGWEFLKQADPARYRSYNEFKSAVRLLTRRTSIREFTRELSVLAEQGIVETFTQIEKEHAPADAALKTALVALGKLGGQEITVGSDIDLIFLYYEGDEKGSRLRLAQTLARKLVESLHSIYEIDFRLRPEGKSSPLATEFQYYKAYLKDRASLWERQSLVKARTIAGDPLFRREVTDAVFTSTFHSALPVDWTKQLRFMRAKMEKERSKQEHGVDLKVGRGGLIDLEFALQAVQLRYGNQQRALSTTNSFDVADLLVGCRVLSRRDGNKLVANLERFRMLETLVRLNSETGGFVVPRDEARLQALAAAIDVRSIASFMRMIQTTRRENRYLFNQILRTVGT